MEAARGFFAKKEKDLTTSEKRAEEKTEGGLHGEVLREEK